MELSRTSVLDLDTRNYAKLLKTIALHDNPKEAESLINRIDKSFSFLSDLQKSKAEHALKSSYVIYYAINVNVYHTIMHNKDTNERLIEIGHGLYGHEYGMSISLTNLMYYSRRGTRPYCDLMQALSDSSPEWKELLLSFPKAQTARFEVTLLPQQHATLLINSSYGVYNACYMRGVKVTPVAFNKGVTVDVDNNEQLVETATKMAELFASLDIDNDLKKLLQSPFMTTWFLLSGDTGRCWDLLTRAGVDPIFLEIFKQFTYK